MSNKFDFKALKEEIKDLDSKEQQKKLIIARTDYLQNFKPKDRDLFDVPFNELCDLEIQKIKEIIALDER